MADTENRAPNSDRGEFNLMLDGQDMVLRPSHEAISEFENETGKGLMQLTQAAAVGTLTTLEMAIIATACIRAWGRATDTSAKGANIQKIKRLIMESDGGVIAASTTLAVVLALAATGGVTAEGEAKATTNPKTTD
ncbi:MAG TPA: GTA-gp10 family protein [Sphingobium sp.]|uniref:GTA-gp10 family protein n=1 Tax=Sphingobium sp. TaxID=1912891 RepID=UPI002ED5C828